MINHAMHVIAVPNLKQSSDFYQNVLGFEIFEIGDPGWRIYKRDNCRIMAGECKDATPPGELGDHSYFCYLDVENCQAYYDEVCKTDADIIKPIRDEPWKMREFAIKTIDGHRIMIGEDLEKN